MEKIELFALFFVLSGVQVQGGELQLPDEQNYVSSRGFHPF